MTTTSADEGAFARVPTGIHGLDTILGGGFATRSPFSRGDQIGRPAGWRPARCLNNYGDGPLRRR
jgi:hypothetical protein